MLHLLKKILFHKQFQKLSIYGFGQLFNLVTPLLVVPYIVSVCGEENFGKTAVGMAIAFFLIVFVDYGSDIIGVREVAVNRDNFKALNKIFTTTYVVKAIILIVVLVITSIVFMSFPYFKTESKMFFLGLLVLIGQFISPSASRRDHARCRNSPFRPSIFMVSPTGWWRRASFMSKRWTIAHAPANGRSNRMLIAS